MSYEYASEQSPYEEFPEGHPRHRERRQQGFEEGYGQEQQYPVGHPQYVERNPAGRSQYEQAPVMNQDESARSGFGSGGQQGMAENYNADQSGQARQPIIIDDAPAPENLVERVVDGVKSIF